VDLSYTLRNVLLGSALLGLVGGVLGSFAVLRRQSLLGDALAHAALPGVCLAFLLTGQKSPAVLLGGAAAAGIVGALCVLLIVRGSRLIKEDSAIGIVLSVFFAVGIVLVTLIQKLPGGNQSGLDKYLFGQAASLVGDDLAVMGVLSAVVLALVVIFYKELKLLCFDRAFGASLGFPMRGLEVLLTCLLVAVVVVGIQMVGVVLMVATLVTPAAAARQWTDRLGRMVLLSGAMGTVCAVAGVLTSTLSARLPPGPTIVLASSLVLGVSIFFAPRRGIIWARLRERATEARIRTENLLKDLYGLGEAGQDWASFVSLYAVRAVRGQSARRLRANAMRLVSSGLGELSGDEIRLSSQGVSEAEKVIRRHRLWEVYLTRRLDLPTDHVHRDAEAMEHALTDEAVDELEQRLGFPAVDPHGKPIPPRRRS